MSYLVLARKWRPQTFEDVVGQEHVTRTLQNALKQDHLAHALLFSGPRGVGKTSIARILAKSMNCEKGPAPVPCNECGICREITEGASVDVLEIDGASNRGIDEIRQLRETIRFQPVRCRCRVFIIDEVHMLTKEAFNALLKTLEEPPPHVFFVFATTEPHRIPATIHSRCQHYEFRRIQTTRLADHLDRIVEAEGLGLSREATLLLAREAEGSVRDSLSLLDQVAAYGARSIDDVHEALGVLGTTVMQQLAIAIVKGDVQGALEVAADVYRLGVDFQKFTSDLALFFRNVLVLKKIGAQQGHMLAELDISEAQSLADAFSEQSSNTILNILNTLMQGQSAISSSSTPRLSLELLLIKLCSLKEVVSVDALVDSLKRAVEKGVIVQQVASPAASVRREQPTAKGYGTAAQRERESQKQSAVAVKEEEPPLKAVPRATEKKEDEKEVSKKSEASSSSVPLEDASWKRFTDHVKGKKPSLASVLSETRAVLDPDKMAVTLHTSKGIHHEMLSDKDYAQALEDMGLQFFGSPVKIKVKKEADSGSQKKTRDAGQMRRELVETPLVQEAMKVFGAKISGVQFAHVRRKRKGRK